MIFTNEKKYGEVCGSRKVFVNKDNETEYFSEIKGRKFQIPFFDDEYQDAFFKDGYGIIDGKGVSENVMNSINSVVNDILNENKTPYYRTTNRLYIYNTLNKLL